MIRKISIKNFKCLKSIPEIALGKVNLLAGVNGKGKSSFLQVLLILSQSWRKAQYGILNPDDDDLIKMGGYASLPNSDSDDKEIVVGITTDSDGDEEFVMRYEQCYSNPDIGELIGFRYNGKDMLADEMKYSADYSLQKDVEDTTSISTIDSFPALMQLKNIYYVSANRQAPLSGIFNHKENSSSKTLLPNGSNVIGKMWELSQVEKDKLKNYLNEVFDGASIDLKEEGDIYKLLLDSNGKSGHLYSPVNVGYGFSYILLLLTSLVISKKGDIVIIENPEAHLHPSAQARVMQIIINESITKGVQMMVETHSDHIVNALQVNIKTREDLSNNDAQIVFFGDDVRNLEITKKGRILSPPKSFCDQYSNDLDVLFS